MRAIVAVDENFGIGRKGQMLFHLPGDLQYFKRMTKGKALVMGRATLDSLPGGRPLPGRVNIVLTRNPDFQKEGVRVAHSLAELKEVTQGYDQQDLMVIGGQAIYEMLMDYCDLAYVTHIKAQAPSDRHFPNLNTRPGWSLRSCEPEQTENGLRYAFCTYENQHPKPW